MQPLPPHCRLELTAQFGATDAVQDALEKDYVSAGRQGYVVRESDGARILDRMRWGFPPPAGAKAPVVKVRNYESPFWRTALKAPERRCLVPVIRGNPWLASKPKLRTLSQVIGVNRRGTFRDDLRKPASENAQFR